MSQRKRKRLSDEELAQAGRQAIADMETLAKDIREEDERAARYAATNRSGLQRPTSPFGRRPR